MGRKEDVGRRADDRVSQWGEERIGRRADEERRAKGRECTPVGNWAFILGSLHLVVYLCSW